MNNAHERLLANKNIASMSMIKRIVTQFDVFIGDTKITMNNLNDKIKGKIQIRKKDENQK